MHWFVWPIVYLCIFYIVWHNSPRTPWQIVSEDASRCCILRKRKSGLSQARSHTHSHVQIEMSKAL